MASAASVLQPIWEHRLTIVQLGEPVPKGSMKGFPIKRIGGRMGVALTNSNPKTAAYERDIAKEAFLVRGHNAPIEEPVSLLLRFFMQRPKSAKKSVIVPAVSKNDCDKLQRCVFDGLKKGGVYKDDGQVVHVEAWKLFAAGWGDPEGQRGVPRVEIEVRRLI